MGVQVGVGEAGLFLLGTSALYLHQRIYNVLVKEEKVGGLQKIKMLAPTAAFARPIQSCEAARTQFFTSKEKSEFILKNIQ